MSMGGHLELFFSLLLLILLCEECYAVILQTRTIGQVPDIGYNMEVAGSDSECTHVIAEGELNRLYIYVRFDDLGEVQASIQDLFLSIRIIDDDISLDLIDHPCLQIGGFNYYEPNCEYFGAWPEASIFSPDDNPLQVANYYLDFSSMIFGHPASASASASGATGDLNSNTTSSSSTYEVCLGNGWEASLGAVQFSGSVVFSDGELTLTGLPPTASPTATPTETPTAVPSSVPTSATPTMTPSSLPSSVPTDVPSQLPTSGIPTLMPSGVPSESPVTSTPTVSGDTNAPTHVPTSWPTFAPTVVPSSSPSVMPTSEPTATPSVTPTHVPSVMPTSLPSASPTPVPSCHPSTAPTYTQAPSSSPLLLDSACDATQSLSFTTSLGALESDCVLTPVSGALLSALNISLLFTRQLTSFTESPSDLAILLINTATGEGLQVGGAALTDDRVTLLEPWPASWHHMHVAAGVASKPFSALLDLSSFGLQGGHVYRVCLKNSFYFSEGVQYTGSLQLEGLTTACDLALPMPSTPPTLAPSISLAPSQGKPQDLRQVALTVPSAVGARPVFSFDALLSGGESVCVVTSQLAGAPTALLLSLTATYKDASPGASWASDLTISVALWNSQWGGYGNHSEYCAHVSGEEGGGGAGEQDSCERGATWPAVMNSGIDGLLYANVTVELALSPELEGNLGVFDTREVCMGNGFLQSEDVRYQGSLSFEGMLTALPPTMAPTSAAVSQQGPGRSSSGFMSPSMLLVAISVCVLLFVSLLGGTYLYRRNKLVYRKGASVNPDDEDDNDNNDNNEGSGGGGGGMGMAGWPQDRDRDRDRDMDSLSSRSSVDEGDEFDPARLFSTALRGKSKKQSGLDIHEAKDNTVRNKQQQQQGAVKSSLVAAGPLPLPPPRRHGAAPNMDLSSFFGDVINRSDSSDSTSPKSTGTTTATAATTATTTTTLVHPLPPTTLSPAAGGRMRPLSMQMQVPTTPRDSIDVIRSNSNLSEEMGFLFDPFEFEEQQEQNWEEDDDEEENSDDDDDDDEVQNWVDEDEDDEEEETASSPSLLSALVGSATGPSNRITLPPMASLKHYSAPTETDTEAKDRKREKEGGQESSQVVLTQAQEQAQTQPQVLTQGGGGVLSTEFLLGDESYANVDDVGNGSFKICSDEEKEIHL